MNDVNAAARMTALVAWLNAELGRTDYRIEPASADASFRRYFRITLAGQTSIVMDAPPEQEDCRPFVRVAALLADAGVAVPRVLAQDLAQGFLLLSDVGRQTYLDILDEDNVDPLLRGAGDTLIKWQLASKPAVLPVYDRALLERELRLFPDWYIGKHMQTELSVEQQSSLQDVFTAIVNANLAQANVYVHRDYMPRNLMISPELPANVPAVLDFQDAVYGPISYDIACLYKDAFISWDEERVLDGTIRYWEKAKKAALPVPPDFGDFYRDVEWMGLQRHLKVLGIFARINYRDGKPKYLTDTPRFVNYVRRTGERYTALFPLIRLFDKLKIDDGRAKITGYTF